MKDKFMIGVVSGRLEALLIPSLLFMNVHLFEKILAGGLVNKSFILLTFFISMSWLIVRVYDFCISVRGVDSYRISEVDGSHWFYKNNGDGSATVFGVTKVTGSITNVKLPDKIDGLVAKSGGDSIFYNIFRVRLTN